MNLGESKPSTERVRRGTAPPLATATATRETSEAVPAARSPARRAAPSRPSQKGSNSARAGSPAAARAISPRVPVPVASTKSECPSKMEDKNSYSNLRKRAGVELRRILTQHNVPALRSDLFEALVTWKLSGNPLSDEKHISMNGSFANAVSSTTAITQERKSADCHSASLAATSAVEAAAGSAEENAALDSAPNDAVHTVDHVLSGGDQADPRTESQTGENSIGGVASPGEHGAVLAAMAEQNGDCEVGAALETRTDGSENGKELFKKRSWTVDGPGFSADSDRFYLQLDGKYKLVAGLTPKEGSYAFNPGTGILMVGKEQVGKFSCDPIAAAPLGMDLDVPATQRIPCVSVVDSEIMAEIQNSSNADAFFVLPAQFNGAEYPDPKYITTKIEQYKDDNTSGPRGQLAVHPAAGQFMIDNANNIERPGEGINAVDRILKEAPGFDVVNGYLKMPMPKSAEEADKLLESFVSNIHTLRPLVMSGVPACGLTSSKREFSQMTHKVNLIYASAVPVNAYFNKAITEEQKLLHVKVAEAVLVAQYFGALKTAARAAGAGNATVFLMPLGDGVFNNAWENIAKGVSLAVEMITPEDREKLAINVLTWKEKEEGRILQALLQQTYNKCIDPAGSSTVAELLESTIEPLAAARAGPSQARASTVSVEVQDASGNVLLERAQLGAVDLLDSIAERIRLKTGRSTARFLWRGVPRENGTTIGDLNLPPEGAVLQAELAPSPEELANARQQVLESLEKIQAMGREREEMIKEPSMPPKAVRVVAESIMQLLAGILPTIATLSNGRPKDASWAKCLSMLKDKHFFAVLKSIPKKIDENKLPQRNVDEAMKALQGSQAIDESRRPTRDFFGGWRCPREMVKLVLKIEEYYKLKSASRRS